MEIKVLGTGCTKCKMLYNVTREAVNKAGVEANVTKVEDFIEIMQYGVMSTPALVINGEVVSNGKVPSVDDIVKLINS